MMKTGAAANNNLQRISAATAFSKAQVTVASKNSEATVVTNDKISQQQSQDDASCCPLTFEQVERAGKAAEPLSFDAPRVESAICQDIFAWDPKTGDHELCVGVICRDDNEDDENDDTENEDEPVAYWPRKRLQTAIYGSVWACSVLRPQQQGTTRTRSSRRRQRPIEWEITQERVAIKKLDLAKMERMKHKLAEDPVTEIAAMQFLEDQQRQQNGRNHHLVTSRHVWQDDDYLYSVMEFCRHGDLFDLVNHYAYQNLYRFAMPEPVARQCFMQILDGVAFLHRHGICHRDLSLENVMVHKNSDGDYDDDDNENETTLCKIIDFGMCLRIPFSNPNDNSDTTTDAGHGSTRRLMTPQGTCGKWRYMSPEVRRNKDNVDGFAVDLWSVGVMLFIMLTGSPPYEQASASDPKYHAIVVRKGLKDLLRSRWGVDHTIVSDEACDLLQCMLQENPRERLTMAQIRAHPWVTQGDMEAPELP